MPISLQVLDSAAGRPVRDLMVTLHARVEDGWVAVEAAHTDDSGRVGPFGGDQLPALYRLVLDTSEYFADQGADSLFHQVVLSLRCPGNGRPLGVTVLLSPFSYTTYQGA